MRFFEQMLQVAADESAKGNIVLAPFCVVASQDQTSELKGMLDRMHFDKIDMSESIVVITNQNGYIGTSTSREMAYALARGKGMDIREFDIPDTEHLGVGTGHHRGGAS